MGVDTTQGGPSFSFSWSSRFITNLYYLATWKMNKPTENAIGYRKQLRDTLCLISLAKADEQIEGEEITLSQNE